MTQLFAHYQFILKLSMSIGIAIAITLAEYFIYNYYLPRAREKHLVWRETLLSSAHPPFIALIWLLSLSFALESIVHGSPETAQLFYLLRRVVTLALLFWFIMRFIRRWERSAVLKLQRGQRRVLQDSTSVHALAQLLRTIAVVTVILTSLSAAGISISTLLAFGGIGGLAISFAAKDTLANFIGGLMIFWDRPFSVGDTIRSPNNPIEGVVESIGWRLTCIRTPDRRPLYIPNGMFSNVLVENSSRMTNRRLRFTLGVCYEDASKVPAINQAIYQFLSNHPDIDSSLELSVRLAELAASSIDILVEAYTKTTNTIEFRAIQEAVLLRAMEIIAEYDAELAYPTTTINLPAAYEYLQSLSEDGESNDRNLQ